MLRRVNIKTALSTTTQNGTEQIRTQSSGACLSQGGGLMLKYAEEENGGEATLVLSDSLADLKRHGRTTSRMTFVPGRLLPAAYATEEGTFDLQIYTHTIHTETDTKGGTFSARYTLLFAGRAEADNELTVSWQYV